MKVHLPREALLKALQSIQGIVESRNTMPVLGHFLLECSDGSGMIHATDLDIGMSQPVAATIDDPGSVCIPAKKFYEIVREVGDEAVVLDVDAEHRVHLKSGRSKFKIIGLARTDFPTIPTMDEEVSFDVDPASLGEMIARTIYATGDSDTRYTLNGILVHTTEGSPNFRVVGTDGHRLAIITTDVPEVPAEEWKLIVTKKAAQEIRKICETTEELVKLNLGKNHLMVSAGEVRLICRLVDGTYPNYQQVLPKGNDKHLTVNRDEFLTAVRRVSLLGKERTFPVKIETSADTVVVSSVNPEVGEAQEELPATMQGEGLEIGFNARYLQDALSHMTSDDVVLEMADALSPTLLREKDSASYSCVIMPMRI